MLPFLRINALSMFHVALLICLHFSVYIFPVNILAYDIILAWDANQPNPEGYNLYSDFENSSPPFNLIDSYPINELTNPLSPMVTVNNLEDNVVYYFAVTAYDEKGNESDYSNIIGSVKSFSHF
jgi:hypothetical protein